MITNFIRMRPVDPNRPSHGAINAAHIVGYKPYGEKDNLTEVILINGHGFITNETVPEFEARLTFAIKPFYVD
jgi:hypothetical protein